MHCRLLPSILAFGLHALALPPPTLQPQNQTSVFQSGSSWKIAFFDHPLDISFIDKYGGNYTIVLDTPTLCPSTQISASSGYDDGLTLEQMLNDFDRGSTQQAVNKALYSLKQAYAAAIDEWFRCTPPTDGDFFRIPPANGAGGGELTPPVNRGDGISDANKGFFTAHIITAGGTLLAAAIGLTSVHASDPETKKVATYMAASATLVILYLLSAISEWSKGQGDLDKYDAALIRVVSGWAESAVKAITDAGTWVCQSTSASLEHAAKLGSEWLAKKRDPGFATNEQAMEVIGRGSNCPV
ncbi:MAG: hypothetical protein Q9169_004564 [Polycauliona sp. 2 TL-2023]